jgi:hypothetical protein
MATHYDRCHSLFKTTVLPHFPQAEERFKRYFRESYNLIRALKPSIEQGKSGPKHIISLNQAFTFLGVKPLLDCNDEHEIPKFRVKDLRETGLDVYAESKSGIMGYDMITRKPIELRLRLVYDPTLLAPILSEIFNTKVAPGDVRKMIRRYKKEIVNSGKVLGYPENNPEIEGFPKYSLEVDSSNELPGNTSTYYAFGMGCTVLSPTFVYPKLIGFGFAAAIVEEIRQSPLDIMSRAAILPKSCRSDPICHVLVWRTRDGSWTLEIGAPPF